MCGIVVVLGAAADARSTPKQIVRAGLREISHRGEFRFQQEVWNDDHLVGGTNRLAFTSGRAPQPAVSPSGRYVIFFNGEVYAFHSAVPGALSDTQAIANLCDEQGVQALSKLDGMFAIAVWDTRERRLTAIRDRFGIKPLYYAVSGGALVVASEIKAIVCSGAFEVVRHLEPGASLTATPDRPNPQIESQADFQTTPTVRAHGDFESMSAQLSERFLEAVGAQTNDGHKYGVFLSGGVDSSAVYSAAVKLGRDVAPLVLGGPNSEDVRFARKVVAEIGGHLLEVACPPEEELIRILPRVIMHAESYEPNVVRQSAVAWVLAQGAHSLGVRVALCGEGADELFGGYPEFATGRLPFEQTRNNFLRDLHRTQLQRVDRMNMAATIEVRVPFLAAPVADIALSVSDPSWFVSEESGQRITKRLFRSAAAAILPHEIAHRPKVVLSEGAGVGGNDPITGMFAAIIEREAPQDLLDQVKADHPEWPVHTKEEALYFSMFAQNGYDKYLDGRTRVFANRAHTLAK